MAAYRTFCRFCIAACGVVVSINDDDVVTSVRGDPSHPVSVGYCCPKGRAMGTVEHHLSRLCAPQLRSQGTLVDVDPAEMVRDLAERLSGVRSSGGPDAIGIYQGTGAGMDAALWAAAGGLARGLGSRNRYTSLTVDAVAKPYVAELMSGRPQLVAHPDQEATLVLLVGMNPVLSHGHTVAMSDPLGQLRRWARRGELWVIDPRRSQTAEHATVHVACAPGTDHLLLAYLVRDALGTANREDLDRRASSADLLSALVAPMTAEVVSTICGVDVDVVRRLSAAIRHHRHVAVLSGTGSTMAANGALTEWLLWCLAIVTDSFEQPGGMWFHPGFFAPVGAASEGRVPAGPTPGPQTRPDLATRWGQRPSAALVDEIEGGVLRALLVVGGNPLTALPQPQRLGTALRRLDVLAVADVLDGPLVSMATHVLPCQTQLERADITLPTELAQPAIVAQYTGAVRRAAAGVRPGWWWLAAIGSRMGVSVLPAGLGPDATDDQVLASLCAGSTFDQVRMAEGGLIGGLGRPAPWVTPLLARGRWELAPSPLVAQWERSQSLHTVAEGLNLIPRRQRGHVNSTFMSKADRGDVALSPADAVARGITDGASVVVSSAHGTLVATARIDPTLRCGSVSIPHGFADTSVNELTSGDEVEIATGMPCYAGVGIEIVLAPGSAV